MVTYPSDEAPLPLVEVTPESTSPLSIIHRLLSTVELAAAVIAHFGGLGRWKFVDQFGAWAAPRVGLADEESNARVRQAPPDSSLRGCPTACRCAAAAGGAGDPRAG